MECWNVGILQSPNNAFYSNRYSIIPIFHYSIGELVYSFAFSVTDLRNRLKSFNEFSLLAKNSLPKELAATLSFYTFSGYRKLSPLPHRMRKGLMNGYKVLLAK